MYIVAVKDTGPYQDIANASSEYAFRVFSKVTRYKLHNNQNTWVIKCPDKLGNMDIVRKYFTYNPKYIRTYNDIPNENEGAESYLSFGGSKDTIGYGFLTDVLDEHKIRYDMIRERII